MTKGLQKKVADGMDRGPNECWYGPQTGAAVSVGL